jgi:Concanavalin A-like lectin/glucanases superfamily
LDTTIDRGPRTIALKLSDPCGDLMIRYGATPLTLNRWYHVAGVYNAQMKTIDVFLDGTLDNGYLSGTVVGAQRSSSGAVRVGSRDRNPRWDFPGAIDDVRIYSLALNPQQIIQAMRGKIVPIPVEQSLEAAASADASSFVGPELRSENRNHPCFGASDPDDLRIPPVAAIVGVLLGFACFGVRPSGLCAATISLGAGLVMFLLAGANLPPFNIWLVPLTALAGGLSVALSARRPQRALEAGMAASPDPR